MTKIAECKTCKAGLGIFAATVYGGYCKEHYEEPPKVVTYDDLIEDEFKWIEEHFNG